jgi:cytochrome bd-type quinol oxidase subunit 2
MDSILMLHSILRHVVSVLLLIVIIRSFLGWQGQQNFEAKDNQASLFLLIGTHIQMVLGFVLYIMMGKYQISGEVMKDSLSRYWAVEHISIMLLAVVLITVGRVKSKKAEDGTQKYKTLFIFNTIALVLILVGVVMSKRGMLSVTGLF